MKTTDYDKFRFFETNRPVKEEGKKIADLKESIKKFGYIESRKVLVTNDLYIIDGQHRFIACKQLQIPVLYEIDRSGIKPETLMVELNKNQDDWGLENYVSLYAKQGVPLYVEVVEFREKYGLGISNSLAICVLNPKDNKAIRNGKDKPLNPKRHQIAEFIVSCNDLPFYKSTRFVYAIRALFQKVKRDDIEKLYKKRLSVTQQVSTEAYLAVFANLINKYKPNNKKVLF